MKPVNKLAATVAMALSIGAIPQASADIMLKSGGLGDALIFPVFWGQSGVDNYFTINNRSNYKWIQAHIRFRNGAWCGELLDFDVILSPGDVFVFRVADVDGDGYWEIDQSLDPDNFKYTGLYESRSYTGKTGCGPDTDKGVNNSNSGLPGNATDACMDQRDHLVPDVSGLLTTGLLDHARSMGHIEVFAEGVLEGMDHAQMDRLTNPSNKGTLAAEGQRKVGNQLGTSLWSWVDAENNFAANNAPTSRFSSDVGNILSGTAFITTGAGMGVAYNAEALVNFRTSANAHRIDNYGPDSGVILHDENSVGQLNGPSPFGDYLYGFEGQTAEDRIDESRISFNNTWGPTIADGDDYSMVGRTECTTDNFFTDQDSWDIEWRNTNDANEPHNSICEVNEAIRTAGQFYTSFYFAGESRNSSNLSSYYFAVFPTKFFVGERGDHYSQSTQTAYINKAVDNLLGNSKTIYQEIWNHEEIPGVTSLYVPPVNSCTVSPCIASVYTPPPSKVMGLAQCVSVFTIDFIKSFNDNADAFTKGRVVLGCSGTNCNSPTQAPKGENTYPFLGYTFELDGSQAGNWRSMSR